MTLCASSTSIPSRLRTTVHPERRVSAISRVSSMETGFITKTSIGDPFFHLIGVTFGAGVFTGCLTEADEGDDAVANGLDVSAIRDAVFRRGAVF